jgi:AraC-like DNA-binding protein
VTGVAFSFVEPGYASLAREVFGCDVEYGASWNGYSVPSESLEAPITTADPEALREASLACQRELDALGANESVSARVRRAVLVNQDRNPSLQAAARMLHMTPRTLHRRLVAEKTSFREIVEEVRHALAVEHLKSGTSLQEIAYKLGYSDLGTFRRAFKRWEAVAPSSFKKSAG